MLSDKITLYKYSPANKYLLNNLLTTTIFFNQPSNFNDPYEKGQVFVNKEQLEVKHNPHIGVSFNQEENESIFFHGVDYDVSSGLDLNIGMSCFSSTPKEHLMWTHYAESHRGICLEYEFEIKENRITDIEGDILPLKVEYPSKPMGAPQLYKNNKNMGRLVPADFYKYKPSQYKYEGETRLISLDKSGIKGVKQTCLKKVIFGIKLSDEDRESILRITNSYRNSVDREYAVPDYNTWEIKTEIHPAYHYKSPYT